MNFAFKVNMELVLTIRLLLLTTFCLCETTSCQRPAVKSGVNDQQFKKTILIFGNGLDKTFIKDVISLTRKPNPKVCFIPTADADDEHVMGYWFKISADMPLRPEILKTFINTSPVQKTSEEEILNSDSTRKKRRNTLNMIEI